MAAIKTRASFLSLSPSRPTSSNPFLTKHFSPFLGLGIDKLGPRKSPPHDGAGAILDSLRHPVPAEVMGSAGPRLVHKDHRHDETDCIHNLHDRQRVASVRAMARANSESKVEADLCVCVWVYDTTSNM